MEDEIMKDKDLLQKLYPLISEICDKGARAVGVGEVSLCIELRPIIRNRINPSNLACIDCGGNGWFHGRDSSFRCSLCGGSGYHETHPLHPRNIRKEI